jgi:hypothetical protein
MALNQIRAFTRRDSMPAVGRKLRDIFDRQIMNARRALTQGRPGATHVGDMTGRGEDFRGC